MSEAYFAQSNIETEVLLCKASNCRHVCLTILPIHPIMTFVTWASTWSKPTLSSTAEDNIGWALPGLEPDVTTRILLLSCLRHPKTIRPGVDSWVPKHTPQTLYSHSTRRPTAVSAGSSNINSTVSVSNKSSPFQRLDQGLPWKRLNMAQLSTRVTTDVHLWCEKHRITPLRDKFHFDFIFHLPSCGFFRVDLTERFDHLIDAVGALRDLPLHMIWCILWHDKLHLGQAQVVERFGKKTCADLGLALTYRCWACWV